MTEQQILSRIEELKAQTEQLKANLNAVGGAIQDCEYWLEEVRKSLTQESNSQ